MNLVLLFSLFAGLSFSLPRGAGADRVDALGQQFRAEMAVIQVDSAAVEPLAAVSTVTINAVNDSIPLCDPNALKTGLPPTSLCRIENVHRVYP